MHEASYFIPEACFYPDLSLESGRNVWRRPACSRAETSFRFSLYYIYFLSFTNFVFVIIWEHAGGDLIFFLFLLLWKVIQLLLLTQEHERLSEHTLCESDYCDPHFHMQWTANGFLRHFDFLYFLHVHPFHGREFPAWLNVDLVVCNVRIITINSTFFTFFLLFCWGYTAMKSSMIQQELL